MLDLTLVCPEHILAVIVGGNISGNGFTLVDASRGNRKHRIRLAPNVYRTRGNIGAFDLTIANQC